MNWVVSLSKLVPINSMLRCAQFGGVTPMIKGCPGFASWRRRQRLPKPSPTRLPMRLEMMTLTARMVESLLGPFETEQLVSEIVTTAAKNLQAEICSLWLVDASGKLRLADGVGFSTKGQGRPEQTYHLPTSDVDDSEIEGITAW